MKTVFVWVDYYEQFPTKVFATRELGEAYRVKAVYGDLIEVPYLDTAE